MAAGAQAETVVGEAAAPIAAEGASKRSRRRRRIRHRANGAPRSCVLESGKWINLPRARRVADVRVTAVRARKQQRRCRFHDTEHKWL